MTNEELELIRDMANLTSENRARFLAVLRSLKFAQEYKCEARTSKENKKGKNIKEK